MLILVSVQTTLANSNIVFIPHPVGVAKNSNRGFHLMEQNKTWAQPGM